MANIWNFLVFDDDQGILDLLVELLEEPGLLGDDIVRCKTVNNFAEAQQYVKTGNFDLVVLDLQDGVADAGIRAADAEQLSGERILCVLKENQFIPVIFHTGYADKIGHLESHFVKVVRKGATDELMRVVVDTFQTKLPSLIRYIQDEQRKYLWGHVEEQWNSSSELNADGEVAYLLARRLANSLSSLSIRRFFNPEYDAHTKIHPVEYYIWPSINPGVNLGDIYQNAEDGGFYLVINPACDFEQGKAEIVLLVRCRSIEEFSEFNQVKNLVDGNLEISGAKRKELVSLVGDNRKAAGGQPDRYKYLPGTSFIPHLITDFQSLSQVPIGEFLEGRKFDRIATLDTPFAEGVQAKFARYYGRFGVPDLDFEAVAANLILSMRR